MVVKYNEAIGVQAESLQVANPHLPEQPNANRTSQAVLSNRVSGKDAVLFEARNPVKQELASCGNGWKLQAYPTEQHFFRPHN